MLLSPPLIKIPIPIFNTVKKNHIFLLFSMIVILNLLYNSKTLGRIFLKKDRTIECSGIYFNVPLKWPVAYPKGDEKTGKIVFFEEYHPGRFNWYCVLSWDTRDFEWKTLVPVSKTNSQTKESTSNYIYGETYEKQFKNINYKEINAWIQRPCGKEDKNQIYLYELNDPGKGNFLKLVFLSDTKKREKIFRKIAASIKIK